MAAIRVRAASVTPLLAVGLAANLALAVVLAERKAILAFGCVALAAVLALAFLRSRVMLAATAFTLVVSGQVLGFLALPQLSVAGIAIQPSDLVLLLILLAWVGLEGARGTSAASALRAALSSVAREPFAWALAPLLAVATYDLARGGPGSLSSARLFAFAVVVPVAVRAVDSERALRALGMALVSGGVLASLTAIALVAMGRSITDYGLSTGGARGLSIGTSFLVASALLYVLARRAAVRAALGPIAPPLVLVLAGGVVASGARETWVGVAGAMAVLAAFSPVRGLLRMGATIAFAGLLAFGAYSLAPSRPASLSARLADVEKRVAAISPGTALNDPSVQDRLTKWRMVWEQARSHPLLGTGFGYTRTYTTNVNGNDFQRIAVDDPENTNLWLLARTGILGFSAWVALNALVVLSLFARALRARAPLVRAAALWGVATLVVVWCGMTFSPVSAFGSTIVLFWLVVGLVPILRRLDADARR